jgi:hypothetical protein
MSKNSQNSQKTLKYFHCETCDYGSCRKSDYIKHLATRKHKKGINDIQNDIQPYINDIKINTACKCGKKYKYNSGYYRHKKICNFENDLIDNKTNEKTKEETENVIIKNEEIDYGKIITELKNIIVDQQKQIGELIPKIGNNNNNNNIKQKFNINVFLNEKCKEAISMNKFIDSLKITLEDLFLTKNKGITEGITNIIIKNMNELSLYERPLHCTDVKRETVYIKSEGEGGEDSLWEKDKEQNILKKAIKDATYMQSKNLLLYTDNNPDWMEKEHKQMEYMKMMKNSTDDIYQDNKVGKVVKKLCNNVYYNGEE